MANFTIDTCDKCCWYVPYAEGKGSCHRHPPTVISAELEVSRSDGPSVGKGVYPAVSRNDFCGEFKAAGAPHDLNPFDGVHDE